MKDTLSKIATRTFGTELELEGITRTKAAETIQTVVGGTVRHDGGTYDTWAVRDTQGREWKAMRDGSLASVHAEVVTPVLTLEDMDTLQKVVRALRAAGAKTSPRCGAHVHVGAEDLTARQLGNLAKIFYRQEALLGKAAGVYESRLTYTKPTEQAFLERIRHGHVKSMDDLNRAWFGTYAPNPYHYDGHRYRSLNFNNLWNSKHTVEFRLFNGTTHAGEVKTNILLALCLVNFAKEAKAASAKVQRPFTEETSKYDTRCFLLRLGMIGEPFKTARFHLLKRLGGSTAWKGERRD